jgi:hypothetical protein
MANRFENAKKTLYWNELTEENDGYGMAVASAFKTPAGGKVASVKSTLDIASILYDRLVKLKQKYRDELDRSENLENVSLTSECVNCPKESIELPSKIP